MNKMDKLIYELSSEALGTTFSAGIVSDAAAWIVNQYGDADPTGLLNMLEKKNGFFAFESSLHVFFLDETEDDQELRRWNSDIWKSDYNIDISHLFCFAEDLFGEQFCLKNNAVYRFNPETAELTQMCESLEEWANLMIEDTNFQTGYPIAQAWQNKNGPIQVGSRLLPKRPFVLGGEYSVDNLYSCNALKGMKYRASIANQLSTMSDGARVIFNIKPDLDGPAKTHPTAGREL